VAAVTGVLLVGGTSSRFGSPKALAEFRGETLAERAWRLLGEACEERIAVGKTADGLALPFALVDDGTDVRAPIAGIVAGLHAASHAVCVALPVDMPLLTTEALCRLAAACRDAAVPQTGPLPGAYRKSALRVLELRLRTGELTLAAALDELDAATVELDPALLVNVNTREQLDAFAT
jgi:molybdopterin-guanine dinucleotide biosynthesis protein A